MFDPVLRIVLGILGLSIVVLVHEAGHYILARLTKIRVKTFSIGFGKRLVGFHRGDTEYRLSLIPLGGYCHFYGEESFRRSLEEGLSESAFNEGDFYGSSPFVRILVSIAGPVANILVAVFIFTVISWIGYQEQYTEPRIILASDYSMDQTVWPADAAGLATGDFIVAVNGRKIDKFQELSRKLILEPGEEIFLTVQRNNKEFITSVIPELDKETGRALIGVRNWVDPIISEVKPRTMADEMGLQAGDRITAMANKQILHTADFYTVLQEAGGEEIRVDFIRAGKSLTGSLAVAPDTDLGITFVMKSGRSEQLGLFPSLLRGSLEAWSLIVSTMKGIRMMFMGIRLQNAVSGPLRLISITGTAVARGFEIGPGPGILVTFELIALISVSLAILNLLPIPVLDGGQILLFLIEWVRRRPLKPRSIHRYQFVGAIIVLIIAVAATTGDLMFFRGQ